MPSVGKLGRDCVARTDLHGIGVPQGVPQGCPYGRMTQKQRTMAGRRKKSGRRGLYHKRTTPDEQAAQREAAFAAIRRLYGEALPLWRSCRRGYCRRHKQCAGDVGPCVARAWPLMPASLQELAYKEVMAGGPRRIAPATHREWLLRRFPPSNFVL